MPSLYSYCIPIDDGAAPNPYWGVCTLAICKPGIRATAREGDWIAGTGSKRARLGDGRTRDLSGRLIYAMQVTKKMTMREYDSYTRTKLRKKVPVWQSADLKMRLGDSIYTYSVGEKNPSQRRSVHEAGNIATDLRGGHALLSTHFYYFGDKAQPLPRRLMCIAQNQQGHRRGLNDTHVDNFIAWVERLGHAPRTLVGKPLCNLFTNAIACGWCASNRADAGDMDTEEIEPQS